MKLSLVKSSATTFEVETEYDGEKARALEFGEVIEVSAKMVRCPDNHRRFFAMLNIVFQNQEHFKSMDDMREYLICKTGRFREIEYPGGYKHYKALSMSYASMDEAEFERLKEDVCDAALKYLLPQGSVRVEIMEEVENIIKLAVIHGPSRVKEYEEWERKVVEAFDGEDVPQRKKAA